jgi:hypothetical protein
LLGRRDELGVRSFTIAAQVANLRYQWEIRDMRDLPDYHVMVKRVSDNGLANLYARIALVRLVRLGTD